MTERSEFRAGGKVLFAAMIGVACGASPLPFNTFGFVLTPLNKEFGWSFQQISVGVLIFGLVASLLAPLFGWLSDRYGVRVVALISTLAFGLAFGSFALMPPSLAGFYGLWLFVGLVGIGSTPITWSRAINMWFFRNRGLALGIMLVGTSLSALVAPRVAVWAIGEYGWRGMYAIVSLFPLLIALPIAFLLFREPQPEERPAAIQAGGELTGVSLGTAMRDRRFWTIWLSILLVALAYGGAHIHMPEIVKQHGFTVAEATGIMGMIGLSLMAGRILTGALLDRFWAPAVCMPILILPAFAAWMLMGTGTASDAVYGAAFLLGFAAGAESDLIAYLAGRYFGMRNYGKIYGMLYMPFGLSSAFSPVIYGRIKDQTGSYDLALMIAAALFVSGALLLITLGRYPDFGRREPENADQTVPALGAA